MSYSDFLRSKDATAPVVGLSDPAIDSPHLFDFQRDLVRWALARGRSAIFADTGLGKTRMQLSWADTIARATGGRVLILAPLAVAPQTVAEGAGIGIPLNYSRISDNARGAITISNYEMLSHFNPADFVGVVLDESSILKDYNSSTRTAIIEAFRLTPYRLACTATPSPNDFTELGNHAEFLGIRTRTEMLAEFFIHDGGSTSDWRIKGHGREDFWRWVCSWAAMVKSPADLGYDASAYDLPPLNMHAHCVAATREQARSQGKLFAEKARGLSEQRGARRATLEDRVKITADLVAREPGEAWTIWCELNDESTALVKAIPGAVEVRGSMDPYAKEKALAGFASGAYKVIVTKPKIAGFGLNWQHSARAAFVGVSHSFEQWYQAIRRNWRFGQRRPVECHIVTSEIEGAVLENLQAKERGARELAEEMRRYTAAIVQSNIRGADRESDAYEPAMDMMVPNWLKGAAA